MRDNFIPRISYQLENSNNYMTTKIKVMDCIKYDKKQNSLVLVSTKPKIYHNREFFPQSRYKKKYIGNR